MVVAWVPASASFRLAHRLHCVLSVVPACSMVWTLQDTRRASSGTGTARVPARTDIRFMYSLRDARGDCETRLEFSPSPTHPQVIPYFN
jgi:hypothetical protein